MHASCFISALLFFEFLYDHLAPVTTHPTGSLSLNILDIGSADINGNNFDAIQETSFHYNENSRNSSFSLRYFGLDMDEGYNVDVVRDPEAAKLWDHDETFDVILSSNCFEHDNFFWDTFLKISAALKPGGFILLIVPSAQAVHRYPVDNWRFFPDAGYALAKYARSKGEYVFSIYSDIPETGYDFVGIFYKAESRRAVPSSVDYDAILAKLDTVNNAFEHYGTSFVSNIVKSHQDEYFALSAQAVKNPESIESIRENFENKLLNEVPVEDRALLSMSVLGAGAGVTGGTDIDNNAITMVNRKYNILPLELLFKIDHFHISSINCRKDVGGLHPIENLMKPHRRIPTYYGGGRCAFLLTIVLNDEDLVDVMVLKRSLEKIQYRFELKMDAAFQQIMSTREQILVDYELHPPVFASQEELREARTKGYNTPLPYNRQKVIDYVYEKL